jgi:flavin reductase (DIM6/NTAB) family NADH-FMN oxidoreductase RutF
MKRVDALELSVNIVDLWMNQWFLLTAGTMENCNMMTVSWGSIGCLWDKPFVQVVVRPHRYTYGYMEKSDSFTLCGFPQKYRRDLNLLGSLSGRNGWKLGKTGLTLKSSSIVTAPSYNEASLILECRKMYFQDMNPAGFLDGSIQKNYPKKDYHRIYFGEILAVFREE